MSEHTELLSVQDFAQNRGDVQNRQYCTLSLDIDADPQGSEKRQKLKYICGAGILLTIIALVTTLVLMLSDSPFDAMNTAIMTYAVSECTEAKHGWNDINYTNIVLNRDFTLYPAEGRAELGKGVYLVSGLSFAHVVDYTVDDLYAPGYSIINCTNCDSLVTLEGSYAFTVHRIGARVEGVLEVPNNNGATIAMHHLYFADDETTVTCTGVDDFQFASLYLQELPQGVSYAVFTRVMAELIPQEDGWNRVLFNQIDARSDDLIQLDMETGEIMLPSGIFRLIGFSIVAFVDTEDPEASCGCEAGYAYIHETETFGSTASPGFGQPSILDTIITVEDDSMVITVDHQVGDQRENIWMSLDNGRIGARVTIIDYAKMEGYGIFGFYAVDNKEMEDGPNKVMFNKVDDTDGEFISLNMSTGLITLLPGIYHISAFSFVMLLGHPTPLDQTNTYLQLQHTTLGHLVNGTVADATYSVPSELHYTLDVATDTTAVIYLEHVAIDATDMWSSVLVNQSDTGDIDTIFSHRWSGLSIYRFDS